MLNKAHELITFTDYHDLFTKYDTLTKISFDYAVVEKETEIEVMRYSGQWKDLGTWDTLTEAMNENIIGNGFLDETSSDVHIINELDMPILAMGMSNVIICASAQGILVSEREKSSQIRSYADAIDKRIMFAEKSWGSFQILDVGTESLTIKLQVKAGCGMHYHSHAKRDEIWNIIGGTGEAVVDGKQQFVQAGDSIFLPAGSKHTIIADTKLTLIELQLGKDITNEDKQHFPINL